MFPDMHITLTACELQSKITSCPSRVDFAPKSLLMKSIGNKIEDLPCVDKD